MSAELAWCWVSFTGPHGKHLCIRQDGRVEQWGQLADECKLLVVPLGAQPQVGLLSATGRWLRADDGHVRSTGSRCQQSEHFLLVTPDRATPDGSTGQAAAIQSTYNPNSSAASSSYVYAAGPDSRLTLAQGQQLWTATVHEMPASIAPGAALLLQNLFGRSAGSAASPAGPGSQSDISPASRRKAEVLSWAAAAEQRVLETFAPVIKFHPNEQAFPCSIEHILQHSTLKAKAFPEWPGVHAPSKDLLARCRSHTGLPKELGLPDANRAAPADWSFYLDIHAEAYPGFSPGSTHEEYSSQDRSVVCAPMYASIQRFANKDYIDIHYIMLYAYQACQTFRITTLAGAVMSVCRRGKPTADHFVIRDFGRHQGDVERVCVRVDPACTKIYAVGCERHGKDCWDPANSMRFTLDQLELEDGTHPVVCAAMNGHASYSTRERGTADFVKTEVAEAPLHGEHPFRTGGLEGVWGIDLCDDSRGPAWRPWTPGSRVILLNRDEDGGNVVVGQEWAAYDGGLGATLVNKFRSCTHIDGKKVDLAKGLHLRTINLGAKLAQCAVPGFQLPGTGGGAPAGLGARPYMRRTDDLQ